MTEKPAKTTAKADSGVAVATRPAVGMSFSSAATFTPDGIREFARLVGDTNPLHHDPAVAGASRFGGLIAAGAHSASVMMAAAAAHVSEHWPNVGLGYSVRLRRPVRAGETVTIEWRIVSAEHSPKLKGQVIGLEGSLSRSDGEVAVTGTCQALILDDGYAVPTGPG